MLPTAVDPLDGAAGLRTSEPKPILIGMGLLRDLLQHIPPQVVAPALVPDRIAAAKTRASAERLCCSGAQNFRLPL